ncbi:hypothetical protein ACLB1E_22415 [Escherichia coli]
MASAFTERFVAAAAALQNGRSP